MKETSVNSRFVDNGDGTITDAQCQLMWMKHDTWQELGRLVSWHQGQEFCRKMNQESFSGHDNWRFPTGNEAKELFVQGAGNLDREGCEIHLDTVFPSGCGYTTWTSESRGAKAAMGFDFRADYEFWLAKENDGFPSAVRLVRDIQATAERKKSPNRMKDNGDGTISDEETGLMWKKADSYTELDKWISWQEAKVYCEGLNFVRYAGHENWRMPTRKEAQSIYEPSRPVTDVYGDTLYLAPGFPAGGGATSWTRTLNKNDTSMAIRFHYYNGDFKWYKRGLRSHGVRAVRNFRSTAESDKEE
jgi:hypothetical protein